MLHPSASIMLPASRFSASFFLIRFASGVFSLILHMPFEILTVNDVLPLLSMSTMQHRPHFSFASQAAYLLKAYGRRDSLARRQTTYIQ